MVLEEKFKSAVLHGYFDGAVAILSSFEVSGWGIPFNTYFDALVYCDEEYLPAMKIAVARAIFLPTETGEYPFLKNLEGLDTVPQAKLQRLKDFFKFIDDGFLESRQVVNYVEHLESYDVDILVNILFFAGPHLTRCILTNCLHDGLDKEVLKYLISFAVDHERSIKALGFSELPLQEIKNLAPDLSEEEVFGLLFCPEEIDYIGYKVPRGKNKIEILNRKERMILLRYYFDIGSEVLSNDGMVEWVRNEALRRESIFERLMAIKVLANLYYFVASDVFRSFAGKTLSPKNIINVGLFEKYNIYPYSEDDLYNCFISDVFYGFDLVDYLPVILVSLCSGNKYQQKVMYTLLDKLNKEEASNEITLPHAIRNVMKHEPIDLLFLNTLVSVGEDSNCLQRIQIEPDREYFIKCLGYDAVAVVKMSDENDRNFKAIGTGLEGLFFFKPKFDTGEFLCAKRPIFKVVRFEGTVYGTNSFCVFGNKKQLVKLEVGSKININETAVKEYDDHALYFYFTLEDARRALFK